ncbi:MAG: DUF3300 domain-containing protein [Acidobacteriaceae bacterium]
MKPTRKQDGSPATSIFQGLTGTLPRTSSRWHGIGRVALMARRTCALVLIALIVPMGQGALLFAQTAPPQQEQYNGAPPPPPPDQSGSQNQYGPPDQGGPPPDQGAPQGQPLSPDELGQMVAPIALYPDALVAQILAASTYPTQVVEADRWVQAQGNVPPEQLAAGANAQNWDPSVKALVAFPSVLAQMDRNIQWMTDLGNAYYNQPDDVMSAVQTMRARAQAAGTLRNTPQQDVSDDGGNIVIVPANPEVVYVPVYNPWGVYGTPIGIYPGYYYGSPAGVYFGAGLGIGFGIGIGIGMWSHWGWGWHNWGFNWRNRAVWYHGGRYYTHSRTVYNRGFNRPGGPRGFAGSRGAYNRGGGYNRGGNYNRAGGNFNRGAQQNRGGTYNRGAQQNRGGTYNRGAQQSRRGPQTRGNQNGNKGGAKSHTQSGGGHQGSGHGGGDHHN